MRRFSDAPIIVVSARADTHDIVAGLEAGADDYVTKPFQVKEITARLRALRRRTERREPEVEEFVLDPDPAAQLVLLPGQGVLRRGQDQVHLTLTEFRVLTELVEARGQVLSRSALLERVWDHGFFGDERLVDVHVRRLRTKVERDPSDPRIVVTARAGLPGRPALNPRTFLGGSLRRRVAVTFALGGLLLCATFAGAAYSITRDNLLDQRERTALRRAFQDARLLRDQLTTAGTSPADALAALTPSGNTAVVVQHRGRWYSSSLDIGSAAIPDSLRRSSEPGPDGGQAAYVRVRSDGEPHLVVGVPIASVDAVLYEVAPLTELQSELRILATVMTSGTLVATALAALVGARLARQALRPLCPLSSTAAAIAAGDLHMRLPPTRDPDLATIVGSFNSMVDALEQRLERDARFAADVSHELRSPLTTLVTGVELLNARRTELTPRAQQVLDLLSEDLTRFRNLLEDLIELAGRDAGTPLDVAPVDLAGLAQHALQSTGRPLGLLRCLGTGPYVITGDKARLERAVINLLDNADRHGGGVTDVSVQRCGQQVALTVEDTGPGVPTAAQERIFERFATASGPRGSSPSTGLGLALVRETALAHGGDVRYRPGPGGGAHFVLLLPSSP